MKPELCKSFARIAQDHRSYARSHGFVARQKDIPPHDKMRHRALSVFHREAADIFSGEVKRLKSQIANRKSEIPQGAMR